MTRESSPDLSEENRHIAFYSSSQSKSGRSGIDRLSRGRRDGLQIREFRESDRRELIRLAAVLNERAETALLHPAGRQHEELLDALTRIPLQERMSVLVDPDDRLRGFAGVTGVERLGDETSALLLGPGVEPMIQRGGEGRKLLAAAERRALDLGFRQLQVELGLRNVAGADFLRHCGYLRGSRRYFLNSRRSTRLHFFKSPRDRVQVLEAGDSLERLAPVLSSVPAGTNLSGILSRSLADLQCSVLVAERDGQPGGLLILDTARPRLAQIRLLIVTPGPDATDLYRLLLAAASHASFRQRETLGLEMVLAEGDEERLEELNHLGFRLLETSRVWQRELTADVHG